jgi:hypothetical protein
MKTKIFSIVLFFLSVIFLVVLIEALLRLTNHTPWTYYGLDSNEPAMHEPDPVLGWKNKEGNYEIPAYDSSGQYIHMTFNARGQRSTRTTETNSNQEFVIVGGSITQGWAINDNETYPWKLQKQFPSLNVLNYGTAGYGSYQSLLVLEKELPRLTSPNTVLYGFNQQHEVRNIAPAEWLEILSKFSRRGHVFVPYVTLDEDNGFVRHPPERYLELPFRESLASIALIEKAYIQIKTMNRTSHKQLLTEQVLLEMNRITEKYGAKFVVALLLVDHEAKRDYTRFLKANNIQVIDCAYPLTADMIVAGEGHPNGRMNSLWAICIAMHSVIQR